MKYFTLILLFAFQSHAANLVCDFNGKEFVTIYGLSETPETHKVTLQFKEAHSQSIVATATTLKTTEFYDWGGYGLEMLRRIETHVLPYPTFHFTLEVRQKVGGHCAEMGCVQDTVFYQGDRADQLYCLPASKSSRPTDPETSQSGDSCFAECGRTCLERPIFCGGW